MQEEEEKNKKGGWGGGGGWRGERGGLIAQWKDEFSQNLLQPH